MASAPAPTGRPAPTRRPKRTAFLAVIGLVATLLGLAGVAIAQDGPVTTCSGDTVVDFGTAFFGTEDNGNRLLSTSPTSRTYDLATPIAAGDYAVDAVSYDGYSTREVIPAQPQEQWFAELLDAQGGVLATTAATADIEDLVVEASWAGSVGSISLAAPATQIRVRHLAPNSTNVNSVRPVCLGFSADSSGDGGENGDNGDNGDGGDNGASTASITVDYENTDDVAVPVSVSCGSGLVDSATGAEVTVMLDDVPGGSTCEVDYTNGENNCGVAITDNASNTGFDGALLLVDLPQSGDVFVDIMCDGIGQDNGDGSDGEQTVTTTPTPTTTTTIVPEVQGSTETAEPVSGDPSFTG